MATDWIAAPVAGEPSVAVRTALLMVEPAVIPVIVKSLVVEAVVGVVIPGTGSLTTVHVLVRLKFVTVKVACGTYFTPFYVVRWASHVQTSPPSNTSSVM